MGNQEATSGAPAPNAILSIGAYATMPNSTINVGSVAGGNIYNNCVFQASAPDEDGTRVDAAAPGVATYARHGQPPRAPRAPQGFLNRELEQRQLIAQLAPRGGAWLYGPPGTGLSALLRQVASLPSAASLPDGVVLIEGKPRPEHFEDIVQRLFRSFFTSSSRLHVDVDAVRSNLNGLRALVVLDRVALGHDELADLADLFCGGAVLISGGGAGPSTLLDLPITGLPAAEARALFVRAARLDPAPPDEVVDQICGDVGQLPLAITLVAHLARAERLPLERLAAQLGAQRADPQALTRAVNVCLQALGRPEQAVLAALLAVDGPDLDRRALAGIGDIPRAELGRALERLVELRLVRAGNDRYAIASASLRHTLEELLLADEERQRAAAFFVGLLPAVRHDLFVLGQEQDSLLGAAEAALRQGRPEQAGALLRAVQPSLVLEGVWGRWGEAIELALRAAEAGGDQRLRAWALHERGSRLGLRGDLAGAETALDEAIRLREALRDGRGAARSRHNLEVLRAGLCAPPVPAAPSSRVLPALVLVAVLLLVAWWSLSGVLAGGVAELATATATRSPMPSLTPSVTPPRGVPPDLPASPTATTSPAPTKTPTLPAPPPRTRTLTPPLPPTATATQPPPTATATQPPPTPTATATPLPPQDRQAPAAPQLLSPPDGSALFCKGGLTMVSLSWAPVKDESGIASYYWYINKVELTGVKQLEGAYTQDSSVNELFLPCPGEYRWSVLAEDNAQNRGDFAPEHTFFSK